MSIKYKAEAEALLTAVSPGKRPCFLLHFYFALTSWDIRRMRTACIKMCLTIRQTVRYYQQHTKKPLKLSKFCFKENLNKSTPKLPNPFRLQSSFFRKRGRREGFVNCPVKRTRTHWQADVHPDTATNPKPIRKLDVILTAIEYCQAQEQGPPLYLASSTWIQDSRTGSAHSPTETTSQRIKTLSLWLTATENQEKKTPSILR